MFSFFCLLLLQTIEANWRCGRHNLQRIQCRSENSKGVYCLQYDDDKIISGLRDNSIKVRMSSQINWGWAVDMKAWEYDYVAEQHKGKAAEQFHVSGWVGGWVGVRAYCGGWGREDLNVQNTEAKWGRNTAERMGPSPCDPHLLPFADPSFLLLFVADDHYVPQSIPFLLPLSVFHRSGINRVWSVWRFWPGTQARYCVCSMTTGSLSPGPLTPLSGTHQRLHACLQSTRCSGQN